MGCLAEERKVLGMTREEVEKWLDELAETQAKMNKLAHQYDDLHVSCCYPQPREIHIYEGIHTIAGLLGVKLNTALVERFNGSGYNNKYSFIYKGYIVFQLGDR